MENLKIKMPNGIDCQEVINLFKQLGCTYFQYNVESESNKSTEDGVIYFCEVKSNFENSEWKKITINQLKDMVVLKRNDIKDSTHEDQYGDKWVYLLGVWHFYTGIKEWNDCITNMSRYTLKPIVENEMKVNKSTAIKTLFDNQHPCLPVYKVGNDIGSSFDHNKVDFTLKYGVNDIVCIMDAEVIIETFDVCPQGQSPENAIERDFKYMQVVSNIVEILEHDIELMAGQKIELTEVQFNELNEKLKDSMVMV